jgi:hypothetical protein
MAEMFGDSFLVRDGERQLCQICLRVVLFGSEIEGGIGLAAPFNAFVSRFGTGLGWYRDGFHQVAPKRLPKGGTGEVFERMRREIALPKGAVAELLAPSKKDEWVAPGFMYWKRGGSSAPFVMISLPLAWFDGAGTDGVEALLREILESDFPLASGYVGLSTFWNHSRPSDEARLAPAFRKWLIRHPGLMHPHPLMQIDFVRWGLVDIGWFTLLGPELATRAGGGEQILNRIPSELQYETKIEKFPSGALAIRAGTVPVLGDQESGDVPPMQQAVGIALATVCDVEKNGTQFLPGFSMSDEAEERREWANRFFMR